MAVPAMKRMSVEEFLTWDSGTDFRYELVNGFPVAQSAPVKTHGRMAANLVTALTNRLRAAGRPCAVETGAALRIDSRWSVRVPDLAVRCGPSEAEADTALLAVEILSPSNSATEMARKRDDYAAAGILEVVEVEQDEAVVHLYRRDGAFWVLQTLSGLAAEVEFRSLGLTVPMAEIYRAVILPGLPE